MHGELGSSRIEENPHAVTSGAGPVQEVIPQVGEMSFRRAGGICPHDGSEQGCGGSLRESWTRGCPDSRTIIVRRTPRLRRYKIEDSVPCPDGTFLGVEGKLGDTDMLISYHCNRLYVTLALSGVYINRRALVHRTTYITTIIP